MITKEQLKKGCVNYVDHEVIPHLSTSSKWVMGAATIILFNKVDPFINSFCKDGFIDEDELIGAVYSSAEKYGKMSVQVPITNDTMTFSHEDVAKLKNYILEARI